MPTSRAGPPPGLTLRPAGPDDADPIAELYAAARAAAIPAIPAPVHTLAEDRVFFAELVGGPADVWVAEGTDEAGTSTGGAGPVAFLVVEDDWVHSLYVRPGLTGQGIGTALLDLAKALRPEGFGLWVFESNLGARRFYARHGLVEVRRTDGADNEEHAPDILMRWDGVTQPPTPEAEPRHGASPDAP